MSEQVFDVARQLPGPALGGPGPPEPTLCSQAAITALAEVAGQDMRMTSLALEVASHAIGEGMVQLSVRTDKRAKSIVFVSLEARMGARLVFSAQGLFSRR